MANYDYAPGWPVVIAGWGQTTETDRSHQSNLRKINTHIADITECQAYSPVQFSDKQLCILPVEGKTTCPVSFYQF